MQLTEIVNKLPNGFHDAILKKIELDFSSKEAKFYVDIDFSNTVDDELTYRSAVIMLGEVFYFSCVVPMIIAEISKNGVRIGDIDLLSEKMKIKNKLPELPEGCQLYYMFVEDFNEFIVWGSLQARIIWNNI